MLRKLASQDIGLTIAIGILTVLGLITVFTTTYDFETGISLDFWQQVLFFGVGYFLYFSLMLVNPRWLRENKVQFLLWLGIIALLIGVLVSGEVVFGAKRWLNIGEFSLQPSEFAKLIIIVNTAFAFSYLPITSIQELIDITNVKLKSRFQLVKQFLTSHRKLVFNFVVVMSILGLIWLQPSLGNTLVAAAIWGLILLSFVQHPQRILGAIGIIFLGVNLTVRLITNSELEGFFPNVLGISLLSLGISFLLTLIIGKITKLPALLAVAFLILGVGGSKIAEFSWNVILTDYQRDRVITFVDPERDPLGAFWQVQQAQIAIASGQITGRGILQGTQSTSGLLPFAFTDFAYAAYIEQFGFLGACLLIGVYILICYRCMRLAESLSDNFAKIICIGVAAMLSLNTIINIAMNLGLMPVTGIPLPLVSYGGSAVLVYMLGFGLVQMVAIWHASEPEATKIKEIFDH